MDITTLSKSELIEQLYAVTEKAKKKSGKDDDLSTYFTNRTSYKPFKMERGGPDKRSRNLSRNPGAKTPRIMAEDESHDRIAREADVRRRRGIPTMTGVRGKELLDAVTEKGKRRNVPTPQPTPDTSNKRWGSDEGPSTMDAVSHYRPLFRDRNIPPSHGAKHLAGKDVLPERVKKWQQTGKRKRKELNGLYYNDGENTMDITTLSKSELIELLYAVTEKAKRKAPMSPQDEGGDDDYGAPDGKARYYVGPAGAARGESASRSDFPQKTVDPKKKIKPVFSSTAIIKQNKRNPKVNKAQPSRRKELFEATEKAKKKGVQSPDDVGYAQYPVRDGVTKYYVGGGKTAAGSDWPQKKPSVGQTTPRVMPGSRVDINKQNRDAAAGRKKNKAQPSRRKELQFDGSLVVGAESFFLQMVAATKPK